MEPYLSLVILGLVLFGLYLDHSKRKRLKQKPKLTRGTPREIIMSGIEDITILRQPETGELVVSIKIKRTD